MKGDSALRAVWPCASVPLAFSLRAFILRAFLAHRSSFLPGLLPRQHIIARLVQGRSMSSAATPAEPHTMRCLEVWGGNQAVNNGVVMAGLDAWLYSKPFGSGAAGGDIHLVSSCAAGMLTRVLLADVSGHGEPVAEVAGKLRTLMRRYVNYIDQQLFVQGLNAEFGSLARAGGFATAVVATFLAPTDELTLCNAGHPRPLWFQARTRTWTLMQQPGEKSERSGPSNTPLGVVPGVCYDQVKMRLARGDIVVMYTDSLIEARGTDQRTLGEEGLLNIVRGLDPSDPGEFLDALLEALRASNGGELEGDDLTVLILRSNGLKPRDSVGTHLVSTMRLLGALVRSLHPKGPVFPAPETGLLARLGDRINRGKTT